MEDNTVIYLVNVHSAYLPAVVLVSKQSNMKREAMPPKNNLRYTHH